MMSLTEWAQRWGLPPAALDELSRDVLTFSMGVAHVDAVAAAVSKKSEARVQSEVRLEAARAGVYLWRNNVGAGAVVDPKRLCSECRGASQGFLRWGLGNDSDRVNSVLKSADLIGVRRVRITPEHVGRYIGQFVSREIKREGWQPSGGDEDRAQARWATLINGQGGDALIVTGVGSISGKTFVGS